MLSCNNKNGLSSSFGWRKNKIPPTVNPRHFIGFFPKWSWGHLYGEQPTLWALLYTHLVTICYPTYLFTYRTYLIHDRLPKWNSMPFQCGFIHNWVISNFQRMVHQCLLVHSNHDHLKHWMYFPCFGHGCKPYTKGKSALVWGSKACGCFLLHFFLA
jgi:hypothetical protein